jgi:hypothetical protein
MFWVADAVGRAAAPESGTIASGDDEVFFVGSAGCPGGVPSGFRLSQNAPHCSFS